MIARRGSDSIREPKTLAAGDAAAYIEFSLPAASAVGSLGRDADALRQTRNRFAMLLAAVVFACACESQVSLDNSFDNAANVDGNGSTSRSTVELRGGAMGTSWKVIMPRFPACSDDSKLRREFVKILRDLESQMSHWRDDSIVSRINQSKTCGPFEITAEMVAVINEAQRMNALTAGAFDITSAPLVDLWGFGPEGRQSRMPTSEQIECALCRIGSANLEIDEAATEPYLRKQIPDLRIDLSALAKGYAIDVLAEYLDARGVDDYLIELGGELRARGTNKDGDAWRIGLETPDPRTVSRIRRGIYLQDMAIATSGTYRNYIKHVASGKRVAHIIDPRTGYPVRHNLVSVSVIDSSAMRADAWATALMVLGPDKCRELADMQGVAASIVVWTPSGLMERTTVAFDDYLARTPESPSRPSSRNAIKSDK